MLVCHWSRISHEFLGIKDKQKEVENLLDHNKRLIADRKAALEEAKSMEIKKDDQNKICQQIKLRWASRGDSK